MSKLWSALRERGAVSQTAIEFDQWPVVNSPLSLENPSTIFFPFNTGRPTAFDSEGRLSCRMNSCIGCSRDDA